MEVVEGHHLVSLGAFERKDGEEAAEVALSHANLRRTTTIPHTIPLTIFLRPLLLAMHHVLNLVLDIVEVIYVNFCCIFA